MAKGIVQFLQGNIACGMGAIRAGCNFYAGYPITPSSDIMHHLAKTLPDNNGHFIQMEDEIASIGAVIGAAWSGAKAMTATSGPGLDLMQESIGYAYMTETPCVIVDVSRVGPSTGQATRPAQGDFYSVRYGTHGDFQSVVMAPWSVSEAYTMTIQCFNYAEMFRQPVIMVMDEAVAHLNERVDLPANIEVIPRSAKSSLPPFGSEKDNSMTPMPSFGQGRALLVTGSTHDHQGYRKTTVSEVQQKLTERLQNKVLSKLDEISEIDCHSAKDAEIIFVAYGFSARAALQAVRRLREDGVMAGLVRLKNLWPFPDGLLRKACKQAKRIIIPEMSQGQMAREIERALKRDVYSYSKTNGEVIFPAELIQYVRNLK